MTTILQDQEILRHPTYGIRLGLYPSSDRSFSLELSRAFGSSTHAFTVIGPRLSPLNGQSYTEYIDRVPYIGTNYYYYRIRSVQDGWTASPYTSPVKAKPRIIGNDAFPQIPLNGGSISLPIYLSTGASLKVGTAAVGGAITKKILLPFDEFLPDKNTTTWNVGANSDHIEPGGLTQQSFHASVVMAAGTIISSMEIRYKRVTNTTTSLTVTLFRLNGDGTASNLCQIALGTGAGSTAWTVLSQNLSVTEIVSNTTAYSVRVDLQSTAAAADLQFAWCALNYSMSNYAHTL